MYPDPFLVIDGAIKSDKKKKKKFYKHFFFGRVMFLVLCTSPNVG